MRVSRKRLESEGIAEEVLTQENVREKARRAVSGPGGQTWSDRRAGEPRYK